jgi:regulator of protease activity HflC (stomatin/prohibitin superfamily)
MSTLSNKSKLVFGVGSLLALVAGGYIYASCKTIPPGNVGVSISKCGGGGVSNDPIPTGYYWKSVFCEDVAIYPTNLQTIILTKSATEGSVNDDSITVTSREGLPINVDVSMSFTLDPGKVPTIYQKYRADINHIAHSYMRQTVREGLQTFYAKYNAEELYSDKKEVARAEVQSYLVERLGPEGFIIAQFTVNEIRVPKQVTDAINGKVAMTQEAQKAEAEVRKTRALAEQAKAQAEGESSAVKTRAEGDAAATRLRADAEAYFNATVGKTLTPGYVNYKALEKWNGQLPQFSGGGAVPFIQIPSGAAAPK